ncbi:MAG: flippase-like domain-containing protein [Parcubacteria group bacterium]
MKILFFNYEYPPLGGGAGNATAYLLKEFSKLPELEIALVTSSIDNEYHLEKVGENIEIHRLPIGKKNSNMHFQTNRELLIYSWKAFWFSKKLMHKEKFDLALAFFGIPCGYLAKKIGLPYIVSLRGSDVPFYNERFNLLDKIFFRRLSRAIWKGASSVVALSHDLVSLAKKSAPNQEISVIYNGINTQEFYPDLEKLAQEKTFNILFVGRLIERKGAIYLLEAFCNISKVRSDLRLLIAGDGPLREIYEKFSRDNQLEERITFFGVVDHAKMAEIFRKSHVFVLPSLNEALGNVTQEALASGLPIITTDTGAAELMRDNGFIIQKKSARDIEKSLQKIIENQELREKMSRNSRELAQTMSWNNVAQKYLEVFHRAIADKKEKTASKAKIFLKILVALGFIGWLILKVKWQEVLLNFEQLDIWWMFAFMVIYALGIAMSSYKWKLLARFKGIRAKFWNLFKIYLTGTFINNFFPSIIGGDAYRSYMLGKNGDKKYFEATSTVLADRITGFAGVMILIVAFSLFNLKAVFANPILLTTNVLILVFFAADLILLILRRSAVGKYVKRIVPEKIIKLVREVYSYRQHSILAKSLAWGIAFNFLGVGVATWMIFLDLHIAISFVDFMIAISIISIVSSIPISVGNIGIKEWSFIAFFGIFGVNGEAAISIAIFGRFLQMIVSFFAIPYYLKEKKTPREV